MQTRGEIPHTCDVIVIGGGPAGTTTAGMLAKEGLKVVLLDKQTFPRNTVGESIVPQVWRLTDALGVSAKVDAAFIHKSGGLVWWNDRGAYLKFKDFGYKRTGLHVEREEFDTILLDHVRELGVDVHQDVIVRHVDLSTPGAPKVSYDDRRGEGSQTGTIQGRYVVDASGYAAIMAKQFGSRKFLQSDRKFTSMWGYFEGSKFFDADGHIHANSELGTVPPVTLQVQHPEGWAWHIIMKKTTSVGFAFYSERARALEGESREQFFLEACRQTPHLSTLLADAKYVPGSLQARPDFSYYSEKISGDDFICVGDAAAFVDPIFSQGVLGCMFHGIAGAWSIANALRTPARKAEYMEMFRRRILGFYSAARCIALGHFGDEGVDMELAKEFVKGLPASEVELLFTASWQTDRHHNLVRLAKECGADISAMQPKTKILERLG